MKRWIWDSGVSRSRAKMSTDASRSDYFTVESTTVEAAAQIHKRMKKDGTSVPTYARVAVCVTKMKDVDFEDIPRKKIASEDRKVIEVAMSKGGGISYTASRQDQNTHQTTVAYRRIQLNQKKDTSFIRTLLSAG